MKGCTNCSTSRYRDGSRYCVICGIRLRPFAESEVTEDSCTASDAPQHLPFKLRPDSDGNTCTNPDCPGHKAHYVYPDYVMCCDVCGCRTTYRIQKYRAILERNFN